MYDDASLSATDDSREQRQQTLVAEWVHAQRTLHAAAAEHRQLQRVKRVVLTYGFLAVVAGSLAWLWWPR